LLRSVDSRQAHAHREKLTQQNQTLLLSHADDERKSRVVKSADVTFALFELYKSMWGFAEPPCFDQSAGAIVFADNVGNQKRVRDAVKELKGMYNNNDPAFCSFGTSLLWRCNN